MGAKHTTPSSTSHVINLIYLWIGGGKVIPDGVDLRSKTKIVKLTPDEYMEIVRINAPTHEIPEFIPSWGFDGSSTDQAEGQKSDVTLKPVCICKYPDTDWDTHYLVLCETYVGDAPHPSNTRYLLSEACKAWEGHEIWTGIEQEWTGLDPKTGQPLAIDFMHGRAQGPFYCGVGAEHQPPYMRMLVDAHADACIKAGITIAGTNMEVMPMQAEFQIGPLPPLQAADELMMARFFLKVLGELEQIKITASFHPKPTPNLNGAGAHTNFSTKAMREEGGLVHIEAACRRLELHHKEHIGVYGDGIKKRLTGHHETSDVNTFRYGVGDRSASIRIPQHVADAGRGYLEDRRPCANADPYLVALALGESICGNGFNPAQYKFTQGRLFLRS